MTARPRAAGAGPGMTVPAARTVSTSPPPTSPPAVAAAGAQPVARTTAGMTGPPPSTSRAGRPAGPSRRPPIAAAEQDPAAAQPSPVDAGAEPSPAAATPARARPRAPDRCELAAELRRLRQAADLSLYALGQQTGIDRGHLRHLENGTRRLSTDVLPRLVGALQPALPEPVPVAELVDRLLELAGPDLIDRTPPTTPPPTTVAASARAAGVSRQLVRGLRDAAALGMLEPGAAERLAAEQTRLHALWERTHGVPWSQEAEAAALAATVSAGDELRAYVDPLEPADPAALLDPPAAASPAPSAAADDAPPAGAPAARSRPARAGRPDPPAPTVLEVAAPSRAHHGRMPPTAPPPPLEVDLLDALVGRGPLEEASPLLEQALTRQQLDARARLLWREWLLALVDVALEVRLRYDLDEPADAADRLELLSSRAGQLARRLRAELPAATDLLDDD